MTETIAIARFLPIGLHWIDDRGGRAVEDSRGLVCCSVREYGVQGTVTHLVLSRTYDFDYAALRPGTCPFAYD